MSSEDIKNINKRLRELSKEAQDLSTLKKKLIAQDANSNMKEKYGDFKYIVKRTENKEIDLDKMIQENQIRFAKSKFGMQAIVYNVGPNELSYHVAKTEEECEQVRIVESIFNVGEELDAHNQKQGKYICISAQSILERYDAARSGQQLEESTESEEVSE